MSCPGAAPASAYSFVRFIGGGLAPHVAGRLVLAAGIHVPFFIAVGVILMGIGILATAHRLLGAQAHGGLPALMDASASRELWRHARSNVLIMNPSAPLPPAPARLSEPVPAR